MLRYESRDLSFTPPEAWVDRSVVAFAAPPHPGQRVAANIVLTRDALPAGETLGDYADRQLVELAKRLDRFTLHGRRQLTVGGLPAVDLRFAWHSHNGDLEQRLVMVLTPRGTLLSLTSTAPRSEATAVAELFEQVLASVRFH